MPPFVPPSELVIYETAHWWVNHRCDTSYPGYLMVGAKDSKGETLPDLCAEALSELGGLLARCTQALQDRMGASRVYCGRYGHEPGHTVHFHVIPVYDWTVDLFLADPCAAKLQMFYPGGDEGFPPYEDFDGSDMTLFIWRRFTEKGVEPPETVGPSVEETVQALRKEFAKQP